MAVITDVIRQRGNDVVSFASRHASVRAAIVFGSQVAGTADEDSDIDIALFIEGLEGWNLSRRMKLIVDTQRALGDDLELHLFPSSAFETPERASFAEFVKRRGVALTG